MRIWQGFGIALLCAAGGCVQILIGDEDAYRGRSTSAGGSVGMGGTAGSGGFSGMGGVGGTAGAGGAPCMPQDDNNDCTTDACSMTGMPTHTPVAEGSACKNDGGSLCDAKGACVDCLAASDCSGTDDACQTRTCTMGACGLDYAAKDTPLPMQMAGDCKLKVCDGNGATIDNNDDADVPDDSNACTDNVCTAGVPSNPNLTQGSNCGTNAGGDPLVCNDMGQCVGCNAGTDCPGTDDECSTRTCTAGVCGVSFTAKDTPVAAQTNNDCLEHVCDGNGNFVDNADDTDLPLDDGNACTDETCSMGAANHPNVPNGLACNDGNLCTSMDTCQMGVCTAGTAITCTASDQCHVAGACDPMTGQCSDPPAINGATCNDGNACTQTDTCQMGMCTGANPLTCMPLDACHIAGTCDTVTGMCSNPNATNGTMCQIDGASGTCSTGVCKKNTGQPCTAAGQCSSGFCADGVCCNGACTTACQACSTAAGAAVNGTCGNITSGTQDSFPANTCSGTNACNGTSGAGACKKINGQMCSAGTECVSANCVDGVCCNSTCITTCQACSIAAGAAVNGTCGNVGPGYQDNSPANVCTGANACTGAGSCVAKSANGAACTMNSQCASANCVDGVCCNSGCSTACFACSTTVGAAVSGTCGAITTVGTDDLVPANACTGTNTCDGAGACKKDVGQTCVAGECANGNCIDGYCCNTTCTGTCQACNVAGSLGTCTNVSLGSSDPVCPIGQSCNGAGACKKNLGIACTMGSECNSVKCVDGVCCNSTCTGTCQACSVALTGSPSGSCNNITSGLQDNFPANTCVTVAACNGMGVCNP